MKYRRNKKAFEAFKKGLRSQYGSFFSYVSFAYCTVLFDDDNDSYHSRPTYSVSISVLIHGVILLCLHRTSIISIPKHIYKQGEPDIKYFPLA